MWIRKKRDQDFLSNITRELQHLQILQRVQTSQKLQTERENTAFMYLKANGSEMSHPDHSLWRRLKYCPNCLFCILKGFELFATDRIGELGRINFRRQ